MQFAGMRTDAALRPLGEPIDIFVKLTEDILPEPEAILVTGTTPQKTRENGISESEFCRILTEQIFTPDTIIVGFNNIRFDDEFIRHTLWRNFYDPYEWSWQEGRSRWDMLDVVRMTRALRPEGINWPVDEAGQPTNRLEQLATANDILHTHAHDALSDVEATIGITRCIKQAQPKLFDWLLKIRDKKEVAKLVNVVEPVPFVYSSGRYGKEKQFTTVAFPLAPNSKPGSMLVYDLSVDPEQFTHWTPKEKLKSLTASYEDRQKETYTRLPIKELQFNRCPAVAPLGVFDKASQKRLNINMNTIESHLKILVKSDIGDRAAEAFRARPEYPKQEDVEMQLYDSFIPDQDHARMAVIRAATESSLADFHPDFSDDRFNELLIRYKARQFPSSLSKDEQDHWELYRTRKFHASAEQYIQQIAHLMQKRTSSQDQFLLEELRLWCEMNAPLS